MTKRHERSSNWPEWWSWDVDFTEHLLERMSSRRFGEVDLRLMLDAATGFRKSREDGRFVVETTHDGRPWAVVVEPLTDERILVVVTAYPAS